MAIYVKPPIGVRPHWFIHRERIKELNEAISRHLEHIQEHQHIIDLSLNYKFIANCAKEMESLALLEVELEKGGAV